MTLQRYGNPKVSFARSSHLSSQAPARAGAPTPGAASWGLGGTVRGWCSLSALCRDVWGDGVAAVHDHGEGFAVVGLLEGGVATHQHVEDYSQAPDVYKKQQQQFRLHSPWPRRFPTPGTLGGAAPPVLLTGMFLGGTSS